jgi:hypothetical protein
MIFGSSWESSDEKRGCLNKESDAWDELGGAFELKNLVKNILQDFS